ncbi:MAG: ABC transporter permease [Myxococcales bacterium]|nr:ABC transporter permease [Polyangiaceae bacterium]MDW8252044.1 ABC transporter permease [Myxococcales bacterium]
MSAETPEEPSSREPYSRRGSRLPSEPVSSPPNAIGLLGRALAGVVERIGDVSWLFLGSLRVLVKRPLEVRQILAQLDAIGVQSTGLVMITGTFVGMVMALQFVLGLQKFGGMEYTGRVISLSFSRELAPSLTAVIVGGRIASGIAAEIGSMVVTEQVDAIRALGADPIKKLVMPRLVAAVIGMPIMSVIAFLLGMIGALAVCSLQFGLPAGFFISTALDSLYLADFWSGYLKTPFFGAIIALVGCHCGLRTQGGTQGVGNATTEAVVITSVAILVADLLLTNLFAILFQRPP